MTVNTSGQAHQVRLLFDGEQLRLAREWRGFTQAQLGKRSGDISGAAISQFERGRSRPTERTLVQVAEAVAFPLSFFSTDTSDIPRNVPAFFRRLKTTSVRQRRRAKAYSGLVRNLALTLERRVEFPVVDVPSWPVDLNNTRREEIEDIAIHVRRSFGLSDDDPVDNVVLELETHGILTTRLGFDDESVDAFSVAYPDRPIVVLCSDKQKRDRSRFDAAHELGHLVMHGHASSAVTISEKQADQFAAAFLMPAHAVADELPATPEWDKLVRLKGKWGSSIASLLYRARTLKKMPEHVFDRAMRTLSARGWRIDEPGDLGPPESPRLMERAFRSLEKEGFSLEKLASESALPEHELRMILDGVSPTRPRVSLD